MSRPLNELLLFIYLFLFFVTGECITVQGHSRSSTFARKSKYHVPLVLNHYNLSSIWLRFRGIAPLKYYTYVVVSRDYRPMCVFDIKCFICPSMLMANTSYLNTLTTVAIRVNAITEALLWKRNRAMLWCIIKRLSLIHI